MKKLEESSVILRFSDDEGVIHDVGLDSILDGGMPIDEESGKAMEYLGVYSLDDSIEPNDKAQLRSEAESKLERLVGRSVTKGE